MTEKMRFASVWDAIEDTPQEAASMRARSACGHWIVWHRLAATSGD